MNDKKLLKIIRYVMIVMVVGTFGGMMIQQILHQHSEDEILLLDSQKESTESDFRQIDQTNSVFDSVFNQNELQYIDEELGFSIEKPNSDWNFNSNLEEITKMNLEKFEANGFLGGVYVEKNGERHILVTVFDIPDKDMFSLENYVEGQISQLEKENLDYKIILKKVSQDKKEVKLGIETDFVNGVIYGEQVLRLDNEKFYMLQYTGPSLELIDSMEREQIRTIIDSFLVL